MRLLGAIRAGDLTASTARPGRRDGPWSGSPVSDKSPRQSASKKSDKSIKEKRADKKAKKDASDGGAFAAAGRNARTPRSTGQGQ
jgi:hypothetical protein